MLTPEYLASCTDEILGMYDELQTAISQDIARSIVKHGKVITTAAGQAARLQAAGMAMQDIVQTVAGVSTYTEKEIEELFREAAVKGINNDAAPLVTAGLLDGKSISLSSEMMQSLEATIQKVNGDLKNLTLTTGSTAYNLYLEQTNLAYMKVESGAYSYQKAISDAIKGAAQEGSWVLYGQRANGSAIRSRLDVAVRRSVLTGVNQTCGKITEMWAKNMGAEYYETTAHYGARPSHMEWQGQIFKINGSDRQYKNFVESTGYGSGDGICGWNCRHNFHPYFPGLSKPAYSKEKLKKYESKTQNYKDINGILHTLTEYECSQMQRSYERSIRESKRVLTSYDAAIDATGDASLKAELQEAFREESVTLKDTEKAMKSFCKQTNRRIDSARTQVVAYKDEAGRIVNFGRSTAQKAVWANKKS